MTDINKMSAASGRHLRESGVSVNLADILGAAIRSGSRYGVVSVGTSATILRIGAEDLTGRHTLLVVNTSNVDIYVGFDDQVATTNGIPILAGQEREFYFDPNEYVQLYAIADSTADVRVAEVK